jgi:DNA processing protein
VAIVGSRRSSLYGQEQAERFAAGLARAGFTIISGLARGIDGCAHAGALKAGGRTIAVLGNGLSRVYPPEHTKRAEEIAARGAVVSELPMASEPAAENFPRRNRIISGLSLGVLVIEAGKRSGSLITAHVAAEQGKEVFALPGRVDTPFTAGTHRLIQEGAKLAHSLEDILDEFQGLSEPAAAAAGVAGDRGGAGEPSQGRLSLRPNLSPAEEAILGALDSEPLTADQIAAAADLPASAVAAQLTMLELKRLVRSLPGQRYVRAGKD